VGRHRGAGEAHRLNPYANTRKESTWSIQIPAPAGRLRSSASSKNGNIGVTPPFVENCTLSREPEVTTAPCGELWSDRGPVLPHQPF
jgi:hypothetical protein